MNKLKVMSNSQVTPNLLRSIASLYCWEKCHILIKGVSKKNVNILYAYEQPWTIVIYISLHSKYNMLYVNIMSKF